MQTILVTGAAGFIGYHLCEKLLLQGYTVIGLDNINDYYDTNLKYSRLHNIENNSSVKLLDFIYCIEAETGKIAEKIMLPMQQGDVGKIWGDVSNLSKEYNYYPNTPIGIRMRKFVNWYVSYYNRQI